MNTEMVEVTKAVAEFDRVAAGIAALQDKYKDVVFDVSTASGMTVAKNARAEIREPRYEVEKIRKAAKAPILALGKHLDNEAARITAALEEIEQPIDSLIKTEETRKEAEKAEKARIDQERIDSLRAKVEKIRRHADLAVGKSPDEITALTANVALVEISVEHFGEFSGEALQAQNETIDRLNELHAKAVEHEAEQLRLAAEREELNRLRAEQAERERVAAAERAEAERKAREVHDARVAEMRIEQGRQEAEQRRIAQEQANAQAEIDRQRRELEEQQIAAAQAEADRVEMIEREKQEKAEATAKLKRDKEARKQREQFIADGPGAIEIVKLVADHYGVETAFATNWLGRYDFSEMMSTEAA